MSLSTLLLGMSASGDMQLCPTLGRISPQLQPPTRIHMPSQGVDCGQWLVKAGRVSLTPSLGSSGVYPSCRTLENQLQSAGQLHSAHLSLFHFCIFPGSTAQGQFPFSTLPRHHRVISRTHLKHRDQGSNELSARDPKAAVNIVGRGERKSCKTKDFWATS